MKQSIIILAVLAMSLFACAQTPPKSVTDNFNSKYPGVTKVKWDHEEANEWEAEFKMNSNTMSASFDNTGKWLETEKEVKKNELPVTILNACNTNYSGYKINEASEIEKPDFKGYELGIEKGKEELEILVTGDGKIVAKKESDEEDED